MSPVQGCPNLTNGPARLSRKCTAGKPVGATAANTCDIFATLVNVTQKVMCCQAAFETVDEWWFFHLTNKNVESFGRGIACFSRLRCHTIKSFSIGLQEIMSHVSLHFLLLGCLVAAKSASFTWKKPLQHVEFEKLQVQRRPEQSSSHRAFGDDRWSRWSGLPGSKGNCSCDFCDQKTAVVCWCIYTYIYLYECTNIIPLKVKIAPKIIFIFQGLYSQVPCWASFRGVGDYTTHLYRNYNIISIQSWNNQDFMECHVRVLKVAHEKWWCSY